MPTETTAETRAETRELGTEFTTPSDREVVARRTFDAPRQLVWDAHTRPEHVRRWLLGPDGWSMPVCEIDLRPGGAWRYVWRKDAAGPESEFFMHGTYREIVPPERIVHTELFGDMPEPAVVTSTFEEAGGRTTLTVTVRYPSKEVRDAALATGMTRGWSRSYDRLVDYLGR
jgi:uncharacterized protein YndB with AHSA1/START domain